MNSHDAQNDTMELIQSCDKTKLKPDDSLGKIIVRRISDIHKFNSSPNDGNMIRYHQILETFTNSTELTFIHPNQQRKV